MSVERGVWIDVEVESVGQRDQTERWKGKLQVTRESDGRLRIGQPTQAGFAAIVLDWDDLTEARIALLLGHIEPRQADA